MGCWYRHNRANLYSCPGGQCLRSRARPIDLQKVRGEIQVRILIAGWRPETTDGDLHAGGQLLCGPRSPTCHKVSAGQRRDLTASRSHDLLHDRRQRVDRRKFAGRPCAAQERIQVALPARAPIRRTPSGGLGRRIDRRRRCLLSGQREKAEACHGARGDQ